MTDGISQDSVLRSALKLKSQGVRVFALGIGRRYRKNQLLQIATNSRHVFTANFRSLRQVAGRISREICRSKWLKQRNGSSFSYVFQLFGHEFIKQYRRASAVLPSTVKVFSTLAVLWGSGGFGGHRYVMNVLHFFFWCDPSVFWTR